MYSPASRLWDVIDLLACFGGIGGEVDERTRKYLDWFTSKLSLMQWLKERPKAERNTYRRVSVSTLQPQ